MPVGHPEDYAPEELQYGVSEFARVFGREPATDMEMEYVSRIIAGADAEELAAQGDPNEEEVGNRYGPVGEVGQPDEDRLGRPLNGAGDPDIGRADQSYNHRSEQPGPRRGTPEYVQGKPKLRITGGEDDLPETDSFDYSGDIDAEPRMDQPMPGSPQMLMQEMMQGGPMPYQGEPDPSRMAGAAGGPGGVDQAQALMEEMMSQGPDYGQMQPAKNFDARMGPGSMQPGPGSNLGGDQIFDDVGMEMRSRMGGRDPRAATAGIPPETIQRLIQAIMGGGR